MACILVIDDERDLREICRHALERAGYEVLEAHGGAEGLHLCQERRIDLVLMDFMLPDIGGLEFLRALQTLAPAMRFIAVSGGAQLGHIDVLALAIQAGAHWTLQKPIGLADLCEAVQTLLAAAKDLG
jgi:CheY-like chemotaxis protein